MSVPDIKARLEDAESEVTRLREALGRNGEEIAQVIRQRDDAQRDIRKLAEALAAAEERHTDQERRMNLRAEAAEARVRALEAREQKIRELLATVPSEGLAVSQEEHVLVELHELFHADGSPKEVFGCIGCWP